MLEDDQQYFPMETKNSFDEVRVTRVSRQGSRREVVEGFIQGKDEASSTDNRMIHLPNVLSVGNHHRMTGNPLTPLPEKSKNLRQKNQSETLENIGHLFAQAAKPHTRWSQPTLKAYRLLSMK
jgi:hypothetical protein